MAGLAHPPWPRIWMTPAHLDSARAILADLPAGSPILALCPGAGRPEKLWPVAAFATLVERLTGPGAALQGAALLLVGAPGEERLGDALAAAVGGGAALPRIVNLIGRYDLLTQAACLAQASLFVGNDSGLTHVAAALGIPALGVFGPTDPRQYAPFGPRSGYAGGSTDGPKRPIDSIDPDHVAEQALTLLGA